MSANSTNSSPRRYSLRVARDPAGRKTALVMDLNSPPPQASSPHSSLNVLLAAAVDASSSSGPSVGGAAAPIDVEAIGDDEIQFLSYPTGIRQARNQYRRKNRVILVIDEEQEGHSRRPVTVTHPYHSNKRPSIPPNKTIINCESYSSFEGKKKAVPEPKKAEVPKEPSFGCPICMDKLMNPCSTVCGHIFCESCLKDAITSQKKCPTCRSKMTNKSFHRVFLPNATAD